MILQLALTGGIASGKTAVSNYFAKLGANVVDADIVAREVVAENTPGLQSIRDYFGSEVINSNGTLNRSLLRSIVFEDEQERVWLNNLLHPLIRSRMQELRSSTELPYSLSVIPLLFESNQWQDYQRIIVVDCPKELQLQRLIARDDTNSAQAESILDSQASRQQRLSIADDVIDNSSDLQSLYSQVIKLHKHYLFMANNIK